MSDTRSFSVGALMHNSSLSGQLQLTLQTAIVGCHEEPTAHVCIKQDLNYDLQCKPIIHTDHFGIFVSWIACPIHGGQANVLVGQDVSLSPTYRPDPLCARPSPAPVIGPLTGFVTGSMGEAHCLGAVTSRGPYLHTTPLCTDYHADSQHAPNSLCGQSCW